MNKKRKETLEEDKRIIELKIKDLYHDIEIIEEEFEDFKESSQQGKIL